MWLPGDLKDQYFSFPFIFLFSPFVEPDIEDYDIQKQTHMQGTLESHCTGPGKSTGSENTWKDLSLYLSLIFSTDSLQLKTKTK